MLNQSKGNMYSWVTHTWNTIKGACPHDCAYCYMKRWGQQAKLHFEARELKTDLGRGNFIFVGSSCDMFAEAVPIDWIYRTLDHCTKYNLNRYLFQTKNPERFLTTVLPMGSVVCTTLETNRHYPDVMRHAPAIADRVQAFAQIPFPRYITIEPILDFDLEPFVALLKQCAPVQVNLGADSGHNGLPEPPAEKIKALVAALQAFTVIDQKRNLKRIVP